MRCTACHSYIPEGLTEPAVCPQCGKTTSPGQAPPSRAQEPPKAASPISATVEHLGAQEPQAFAPYFTIRARLAFRPARASSAMKLSSEGSISFGADGFSIVCLEGRHWEKIHYRDLGGVRAVDDSVSFSVGEMENRLTIFHPWLPSFMAGPKAKRARTFVELLSRVRGGLQPFEIAAYRQLLG